MSSCSVLVVEDEAIVSRDIQQSLKKFGYSIAGSCSKAEDAITAASELSPDIILMDIMLKGQKTGIEAAEIIRKTNNIPTVFLTAYADENTLAMAKQVEPYGYILKPFKEIELRSVIEMAIYKHKKDSEIVTERELLKNQLKHIVHTTMKEIERRLSSPSFLRAHRSFIVRKDKIVAIDDHHLILKNNKKVIPVGGLYKHNLYDALNLI